MKRRIIVNDGKETLYATSEEQVASYYGVRSDLVKLAIDEGTEIRMGVTVDVWEGMYPPKPSPCFARMNAVRHKDGKMGSRTTQTRACRICLNCSSYATLFLPDGSTVGICRMREQEEKPVGLSTRWLKLGSHWYEIVGRWFGCAFYNKGLLHTLGAKEDK